MSLWDLVRVRYAQGKKTIAFPPSSLGPGGLPDPPGDAAGLPAHFRGLPLVDATKCADGCKACVDSCPTQAIKVTPDEDPKKPPRKVELDLGRCVFCTECTAACPTGAIRFTNDYRLASSAREDLVLSGAAPRLARSLDERMRRLFGRSLKLRQVSAAGCNGCEAELVATGNIIFDLGRFGVQFVASPRHADGIVVTGPVSRNMRHALEETYNSVPAPKIVIAVGACAISGGPYFDSELVHGGAAAVVPVDLFIPGCPPHPLTVLDGMLRLLGRLERGDRPAIPASPPASPRV
jgi:Ni,Fe-hydrogenase III small subunit/NAD-dependent dihydropyrimidine dehydrogenase PreA subunit